ncbi:MAG: hypothetical protein J6U60_02405 [Clostridia bacterium]|nr:hypothetical protein [Clostridia bacterium]
MKILLDENKPFYKANLHCHSTNSDGVHTVEEVKAAYQERGYSIVAFTDHEHLVDNSHLTDENFLALTAFELGFKAKPSEHSAANPYMRVTHFNVYALDPHNDVTPCYSSIYDYYGSEELRASIKHDGEYTRVQTTEGINEVIRAVKEKGFIVCYNHPTWSLENATHYLGYEGLFAVEIYNSGCIGNGRCDDEHAFDDLLRAGKKVYCIAADDMHSLKHGFGGWTCINADKLDYSTVMTALQKGEFYASAGPQIFSLVQDGDKVKIKTSACRQISFITSSRRAAAIHAKQGDLLTEAEFTLKPTDGYFRIRVTDEQGYNAYTQAYPVKEN